MYECRFPESIGTGLLGDRLAGGQISRGSGDKFQARDVLAGGHWTGDEETRPSPSFRPTASFHSVYYTACFFQFYHPASFHFKFGFKLTEMYVFLNSLDQSIRKNCIFPVLHLDVVNRKADTLMVHIMIEWHHVWIF